jgi:hypothetical protein
MLKISVKTDFGPLLRKLDGLQKGLQDRVIARTLNRMADSTKTEATREISREFNITATRVRERILVRRAFAKTRLAVEISVPSKDRRRALNVISFGARQTRKGVSFAVKRGGQRVVIPTAFIGNKGRTVFTRERRKGPGKRLPIFGVTAIDVPQMFNTRRINQKLLANVRAKFPVEFERQLSYELRRLGFRP